MGGQIAHCARIQRPRRPARTAIRRTLGGVPEDQETPTRLRLPPRLHAPLFWGLLGAVTVVALVQRWPGLNPSSLYLDDVWAAFLVKAAGAGEILEVRPPAPLGFLAVLKTLRAALGDRAWVLQVLPLAVQLVVHRDRRQRRRRSFLSAPFGLRPTLALVRGGEFIRRR